ncbi:uncharacterized protein LOC135812744 [Sycon ciliatum]|uniref:uncharacterized protein LOC135812744 n=1 Tax=Sycon ciliatum TaxID=27933 RepID=UPI0031F6B147
MRVVNGANMLALRRVGTCSVLLVSLLIHGIVSDTAGSTDNATVLDVHTSDACSPVSTAFRLENGSRYPSCSDVNEVASSLGGHFVAALLDGSSVLNMSDGEISNLPLSVCTEPCMNPNATNTSSLDNADIPREEEIYFLIGCGYAAEHIQVDESATRLQSVIYQLSNSTASSALEDWLFGHQGAWMKVWLCANDTTPKDITDPKVVHNTERELAVARACLSVALTLLTLCLAFHIAFPELRRDASGVIFVHQCAALWIVIISDLAHFIVGNDRTLLSCIFINILLVFFMNSVFFLAAAQAFQLHRHICHGHKPPISHYVRKATLAAYGISGSIVLTIRLVAGFDLGTPDNPKSAMPTKCQREQQLRDILSASLPFLVAMAISGFLFARIMYTARTQTARNEPAKDVGALHYLQQARVAGSMFVLVGLAWLVGSVMLFISVAEANLVFMVLISIMGVATFLLKIPLDTAFRSALRRRYARWHMTNVSILDRRPSALSSAPWNNSARTSVSADV